LPGQAEATVGNISLKVGITDELLAGLEKLFGEKVAELV
jgi:hypothetical protein